MSASIKNTSTLTIDNESMIAVVRDWFEDSYGPFDSSRVCNVTQMDDGTFCIDFEPKPQDKAEGKT